MFNSADADLTGDVGFLGVERVPSHSTMAQLCCEHQYDANDKRIKKKNLLIF